MEIVITPFSFRGFARDRGAQWKADRQEEDTTETSAWRTLFDEYVKIGGFPEIGRTVSGRARVALLQGYVDNVIFRDIVERHGITNIVALRAFVRQVLLQTATIFRVSTVHKAFQSRRICVSEEMLLTFLSHMEDAFLVFTLPVASRTERRRDLNLRKIYLADHGLVQAFCPSSSLDRGRLVENMVACELARKSRDLAYVKTIGGYEVDFLATDHAGCQRLVQVASDISDPANFQQELRALASAAAEFPEAERILLAETDPPKGATMPDGVRLIAVWRWLLEVH